MRKQALPALCALLLLASSTAAEREQLRRPTLLADVGGAITRVVLSVNSARRAALRNADASAEIVNSLKTAHAYLLLNDPTAFVMSGPAAGSRVTVVDIPSTHPLTIWPQDPFLVLRAPGTESGILLMSRSFERADDEVMAQELAKAIGMRLKRSKLFFEGGNIVSDEDTIFVGANTIRFNALRLGVSEQEVVSRFAEELGRPLLVIGPVPQPVAHIDMILTPLGNKRVAVADARAGAQRAEAGMASDAAAVRAFEERCESLFFGHPAIERLRGSKGESISPPSVLGRTPEQIAKSHELAPQLDHIARALEERGYQVERIPFLHGGPVSADAHRKTEPAYPMLSYNNVLLEHTRDGGKSVYLPRYGFAALDTAAQHAWEASGFNVIPLSGHAISAMYGGALRCAVKVLERESREGDQ